MKFRRTTKRSHGANDYDFKTGVVAVGSLALFGMVADWLAAKISDTRQPQRWICRPSVLPIAGLRRPIPARKSNGQILFAERLCGGTQITTMNTPKDPAALPRTNCSALTESQIEVAARKYCEIMGEDPDRSIGHGADPSPDGRMTMQMCYSPLWTRVALQIAQHDAIRESISFSLQNVNVDSGLEALDVPRLDRVTKVLPEAAGDSIELNRSCNPVEYSSPNQQETF